MNLKEFRDSLAAATPPADAELALQALWWAGKGEWDRAHECAQQPQAGPACDLVHAHLHRLEGDLANAGYWYRRAGRPLATGLPEAEWETIAGQLLSPA